MADRYAMDWTSLSLGDDEVTMTRSSYVGPIAPPPPRSSLSNAFMRSLGHGDTRDRGWMAEAACRGLGCEVFFCDPTDSEALQAAESVCEGCCVAEACRAYADGLDADGRKVAPRESDGVWAGKWRGRKAKGKASRERVCEECSKVFVAPYRDGTPPKTCSVKCQKERRRRQHREANRRKAA